MKSKEHTSTLAASAVASAVQAAALVNSTLAALAEHGDQLKAEREKLKERNRAVYDLPLSKDEVKELALSFIDQQARSFTATAEWERVARCFMVPQGHRRLHDGLDVDPNFYAKRNVRINLLDIDNPPKSNASSAIAVLVFGTSTGDGFLGEAKEHGLAEHALYFLLGDAIKARVSAYFDWLYANPKSGDTHHGEVLTVTQKRAEIGANVERIEAIDTEIAQMIDQVAALKVKAP